ANAFSWMVPSGLRSKTQPIPFSSARMRSSALVTSVQARSWSASHLLPSMVSMKCRSIESPGASATLYPPWTMRVQPHLPSRPLTATVIESDGSAWCACKAAKSPAPPEPRIRMSVSRRSMAFAPEAAAVMGMSSGSGGRSSRFLHAERGEHRRPPGVDILAHDVVEAAAVAVHRDQQRAEVADAELPERFRVQVVQVDILDALDPGGLQGR